MTVSSEEVVLECIVTGRDGRYGFAQRLGGNGYIYANFGLWMRHYAKNDVGFIHFWFRSVGSLYNVINSVHGEWYLLPLKALVNECRWMAIKFM